ncbi:MAG: ThiF family adenylyltransferase [Planctomycetota bacterium]
MSDSPSRYSRQERFAPIGPEGQQKIQQSSALIVGCGALGSMIAERLARSGVGRIRIVDREWVEHSNLQRQTLFTEEDAAESRPKAIAAQEHLRKINSSVHIDARVEDVDFQSIRSLGDDCDILLDGTDNFETRFLVNDYAVKYQKPWIHAGCLGSSGQILSIQPERTACFRCLVPELPPREAMETCDSAGVLGSAIGIIASWQAGEALKVLSGNLSALCRGLIVLDTWNNECRIVELNPAKNCACCKQREFDFLEGKIRTTVSVLCGKNAVQLESPQGAEDSLDSISQKLAGLGQVRQNAYFVKLAMDDFRITIFRGGRTVVEGTTSEMEARNVVARVLGS